MWRYEIWREDDVILALSSRSSPSSAPQQTNPYREQNKNEVVCTSRVNICKGATPPNFLLPALSAASLYGWMDGADYYDMVPYYRTTTIRP